MIQNDENIYHKITLRNDISNKAINLLNVS